MPIRVVVPPAVEPVTNAQAMLWCRAAAEDSALVDILIKAARERAENTTQRVFVQRTMEWSGPGFYPLASNTPFVIDAFDWSDYALAKLSGGFQCGSPRLLLVAPVQSVESVTYVDGAGETQTLPTSAYALDATCEPALLTYTPAVALPTVIANRSDAVRVRFVAGYPPSDAEPPDPLANLPAALLVWMQVQISTWYTQRESLETGGRLVEASRNFVDALLDGLIVSTRFV